MRQADWAILFVYCGVILAVSLYFRARASRSVEDYFIADRKLPWWIIGFADVAGYTGGGQGFMMIFFLSGFAGLWLMAWISWVIWMPLVAILWARWWRRLGVLTTGEFIERRYGGRRAAVYRNVYALYACFVWGITSLGYGTAWMAATISPVLGWTPVKVLLVFGTITILYSLISGLLAVAYNDVLQFVLLMGGNTIFAFVVLGKAGGLTAAWRHVAETRGEHLLQPFPGGDALAPMTLIALCLQGLFFAGSPFAGEGWTAQRYMAARDETHAILGQVLNGVLALVVRLIPFILLGIAAAALYPVATVRTPASLWGDMVRTYAPPGLFGLLLVSCLAGYMAAIASIGNWAASYLMNDIYRRSFRPSAGNRELISMSRIFSGLLLAIAFACGALIDAKQLEKWVLFINSSLVVFSLPLAWLKWFWWRLNAVGDMVGILGGFPAGYIVWFGSDAVLPDAFRSFVLQRLGLDLRDLVPAFSNLDRFPFWMGFGVLFLLGWVFILGSTLLSRPESMDVLKDFYLRVRPIGWWGPVRQLLPAAANQQIVGETRRDLWACAAGILFYFFLTVCLFSGLGGHLLLAGLMFCAAVLSGVWFVKTALSQTRSRATSEAAALNAAN
jgi:SSS family solute:Na+ symporter